jgi:hypothetical protein
MMDWPRYLRALDVMRVREIELDRLEFIRGVTSIEDMDPQVWRAIQLHDRLCEDGNE